MNNAPQTKYQYVRKSLEEAILSGTLGPGHQLPPEQAIASQHAVSLMTARRAVSDLVASDLLERRGRIGTFVKEHLPSSTHSVTVNLITSTYDGASQLALINHGSRVAQKKGWHANIIRLASGQQDAAVRAIRSGELAIVSLDVVEPKGALMTAMQAAKGRVVSVARNLSDDGIVSIKCDQAEYLSAAIALLRSSGHDEIAIVDQYAVRDRPDTPTATWLGEIEHILVSMGIDMPMVYADVPLFTSPMRRAFVVVSDYLRANSQITGLICIGDQISLGTLAACREVGRPCPDSTSVVSIGCDSPTLEFCVPAVTCFDYQTERQVDLAMEILNGGTSASFRSENLIIITPKVTKRESVATVKVTEQAIATR